MLLLMCHQKDTERKNLKCCYIKKAFYLINYLFLNFQGHSKPISQNYKILHFTQLPTPGQQGDHKSECFSKGFKKLEWHENRLKQECLHYFKTIKLLTNQGGGPKNHYSPHPPAKFDMVKMFGKKPFCL